MKRLFAATLMLASLSAFAHDPVYNKETLKVLQEHALTNVPGKKTIMLTVDYAPGQATVNSGSCRLPPIMACAPSPYPRRRMTATSGTRSAAPAPSSRRRSRGTHSSSGGRWARHRGCR